MISYGIYLSLSLVFQTFIRQIFIGHAVRARHQVSAVDTMVNKRRHNLCRLGAYERGLTESSREDIYNYKWDECKKGEEHGAMREDYWESHLFREVRAAS